MVQVIGEEIKKQNLILFPLKLYPRLYVLTLASGTKLLPNDQLKYSMSILNTAGAGTAAAGCPAGYDSKDGDIPGWGQIRGRIRTTMEGCSEECNKQEGCCSYEFSYSSQLCNLNKDCQPSQPKYLDYYFCTKGE